MADLARKAKVSVGGFYARFKNKDALLHALDEHMIDRMLATICRAMDPSRLDGASSSDVVEAYVRAMVAFFAKNRQIVRQIVIKARTTDDAAFVERLQAFNVAAHRIFSDRLLERGAAAGHDVPQAAIEFAMMMVSATAREAVLFGERKLNLSTVRGKQLVAELVRAFDAYLESPDKQRNSKGSKKKSKHKARGTRR